MSERDIKIVRFVCNPIQENCYVVSDSTGEAVIVDCGAYFPEEKQAIQQYISDNNLKVRHLLVTHNHFDHVFGNDFMDETYGLQPFGRSKESGLWELQPETVSFGNHTFEIIPAPGHSPDGVVYYCRKEQVAFTGDTLFKQSYGRTDLEGGNYDTLMATLHKLTVVLPSDTQLLPGHGGHTYMDDELEWIKSY